MTKLTFQERQMLHEQHRSHWPDIYEGPDGVYAFRRLLDRSLPDGYRERAYQEARREFGVMLLDMLDKWPDPVSISYSEEINPYMGEWMNDMDEIIIRLSVWAPQVLPLRIFSPIDTGRDTIWSKTTFRKRSKHMNQNVRDALITLVAVLASVYLGIEDTIAGPIASWLVQLVLGLFGGGAIVAFYLRRQK